MILYEKICTKWIANEIYDSSINFHRLLFVFNYDLIIVMMENGDDDQCDFAFHGEICIQHQNWVIRELKFATMDFKCEG